MNKLQEKHGDRLFIIECMLIFLIGLSALFENTNDSALIFFLILFTITVIVRSNIEKDEKGGKKKNGKNKS